MGEHLADLAQPVALRQRLQALGRLERLEHRVEARVNVALGGERVRLHDRQLAPHHIVAGLAVEDVGHVVGALVARARPLDLAEAEVRLRVEQQQVRVQLLRAGDLVVLQILGGQQLLVHLAGLLRLPQRRRRPAHLQVLQAQVQVPLRQRHGRLAAAHDELVRHGLLPQRQHSGAGRAARDGRSQRVVAGGRAAGARLVLALEPYPAGGHARRRRRGPVEQAGRRLGLAVVDLHEPPELIIGRAQQLVRWARVDRRGVLRQPLHPGCRAADYRGETLTCSPSA